MQNTQGSSPDMIARIKIENFMGIESADIRLGNFNVFVGTIMCGKSSFVKAIQFLVNLAKYGEPRYPGNTGFEDFVYLSDTGRRIGIEVEAKLNGRNVRYRAEISRDGLSETVWVEGREAVSSSGRSILAKNGSGSPMELVLLADYLRKTVVISPVPDFIRQPASLTDEPELGYHGERLALVLLRLALERRSEFVNLELGLRHMFGMPDHIVPHIEKDRVYIYMKKTIYPGLKSLGVEKVFKPEVIPDSILAALAILTPLYLDTKLLVVEYPEHYIDPFKYGRIIERLREWGRQVILVTSSPEILDHVKPEELYVMENELNIIDITRLADTEAIKDIAEHISKGKTLGYLWYYGPLLGVLHFYKHYKRNRETGQG